MGFALAVGAGVLWGTSGPFNVGLFRTGMDPWSAAVLRPAVGVVLLLPLLLLPGVRERRGGGGGRLALQAVLAGGVPLGLFQVAYAISTDRLGVPATVALLYLSPAFVLALQGPLFGERPNRAQVGWAALSVVGVWIAVLGGSSRRDLDPGGVTWGVVTGLSFGSYVLFGRWMSPRLGAVATLTFSTAGAAGLLTLVSLVLAEAPSPPASLTAWLLLVGLAFATLPAASLLFFEALARIDPGRAAVGATVEPLVGTLLALFLLGQTLAPVGWLGLGILLAGVVGTALLTPGEGGSPPPPHPPPDSSAGGLPRGPAPPAGRG